MFFKTLLPLLNERPIHLLFAGPSSGGMRVYIEPTKKKDEDAPAASLTSFSVCATPDELDDGIVAALTDWIAARATTLAQLAHDTTTATVEAPSPTPTPATSPATIEFFRLLAPLLAVRPLHLYASTTPENTVRVYAKPQGKTGNDLGGLAPFTVCATADELDAELVQALASWMEGGTTAGKGLMVALEAAKATLAAAAQDDKDGNSKKTTKAAVPAKPAAAKPASKPAAPPPRRVTVTPKKAAPPPPPKMVVASNIGTATVANGELFPLVTGGTAPAATDASTTPDSATISGE